MAMASSNPGQHQPNPAPLTTISMRRRTIIACLNCRKRKVKCITTEQPPKNPCARCVKKGLPCEYVSAPDGDELSGPPSHTPDTPRGQHTASWTNSGHSNAPTVPTTVPGFSAGRSPAPPLPYTGPPPMTRTPTGWGYAPHRGGPNTASTNAPFPAPSHRSSTSTPGPRAHQPYAHPQYHAAPQGQYGPGYATPGYAPQQQQYIGDRSYALMQPQSQADGFDYSEFLSDYDETPSQSSSSGTYHSSNQRYH